MNEPTAIDQNAGSFNWKYLLPTLIGVVCQVSGLLVAQLGGDRAFLNTHGYFEIGFMLSFAASVVYAFRLGGKGRNLAPQWVYYLNLLYVPLVLGSGFLVWSALSVFAQ